jgi:hypothetical protein
VVSTCSTTGWRPADAHARLADEARAVQVKVQRTLGEVAQHVQLGQGGSGVLQRCQVADQVFQQAS